MPTVHELDFLKEEEDSDHLPKGGTTNSAPATPATKRVYQGENKYRKTYKSPMMDTTDDTQRHDV